MDFLSNEKKVKRRYGAMLRVDGRKKAKVGFGTVLENSLPNELSPQWHGF